MKKLLATTALVAILPVTAALAGAPVPTPTQGSGSLTFLLGIAAEFGDSSGPDVGITGKVLSSNLTNHLVVGGGVTYFPLSDEKLGLDLSAGFNFTNFAILGGYDLLRQQPQISLGYVPTTDGLTCPPGYVLSGGTCDPVAISDRRMKRDIRHVATLSDGIRLYSFRYLWSETAYVGVMAQDLLEDSRWRHAVLTGDDGFYLVDYDQLDLAMVTLDGWNEHGVDAVVVGSRPARLLTAQVA
jgi:hypothetical protein